MRARALSKKSLIRLRAYLTEYDSAENTAVVPCSAHMYVLLYIVVVVDAHTTKYQVAGIILIRAAPGTSGRRGDGWEGR